MKSTTKLLSYACYLLSISIVKAASRYFIESSTDSYIARSRPLDICHLNSNDEYIIYSCDTSDPNKHILTAENHGENYQSCNSANPIIKHYFKNDTSNSDIDEESFSCIGEDTYGIMYEFTNEALCSNYLNSKKKDESNDNLDEVRIIYRATNVCYHHNLHQVSKYNQANYSDEELVFNYCNGFYFGNRLFDDGADCMNEYRNTLPESATSVSRAYSPNICSTDQSGVNHFSSLIMHKCIVNGTEMSPNDYDYDVFSLKQITIGERIGLVDWMVSVSNMHNESFYPWAEYFCHINGLGGWNLIEITENGNIYQRDYETPICGLVLRDPGDLYTDVVPTFQDLAEQLLGYTYDDPFIRTNVNPLNKTIVYGLNFTWPIIGIGGSIPNSICKLKNLHYLDLNSYKSMYGTIPNCIGTDLDLQRLQLITLENITGPIPSSLCNIKNYNVFHIINLRNLTGQIHECLGNTDMNFRSVQIWRNEKLTGTLPENMFCGYHLMALNFHNNSNMSAQTIPSCWSNDRPFLWVVNLQQSKLYGTMPKMPRVDYIPFAWLQIYGNDLEGSISDIFGEMQEGALGDFFGLAGLNYKLLQVFMIHENKFHDDDITDFLQQIFDDNDQGITVISMFNNKYITGTLPDINVTIKDSGMTRKWTGLLLHDLDLYGTIPKQMMLGGIDYLTLHNNRLSGYIPADFRDLPTNSNISTSSVVLLGNLLWTETLSPPDWVNSKLRTASNMYYTPFQQFQGIMVIVIGFVGIFIGIAYCWKPYKFEHNLFHHQNQLFEKKLPIILFFDTMQTLRRLFAKENVILFWITLALIIFYGITSNYYYKVPHESIFALPWYWINPRGSVVVYIANAFLLIIAVIFNWLLLRLVNDMNSLTKQTQKEMKVNRNEFKSSLKLRMKETAEMERLPQSTPNTDTQGTSITLDTNDQLPNGWRMGYTNDGRLYYINDITRETQWSLPHTLPPGWIIRRTDIGRIYYQNNITKKTQWERPEVLAPLPRGWAEVYTVDGREYYQNHTTKETQWERPTAEQNQHEITHAAALSDMKDNDLDDDADIDDIALEIKPEPRWLSALKLIFFFILWVFGLMIIVAYILSSSLPDDNELNLPSWIVQGAAKLLSLMLVLNDRYVIPPLATSISRTLCDGIKGKYGTILFLRLNNEIIVPFIGSIFLLNDCGRWWVSLWTFCEDPVKRSENFDIVLENTDLSYTTLLNSDDVCGAPSILEMDFNKCIRSFLYNWTAVLMGSLVIGSIVQIFSFFWKLRKHKQILKQKQESSSTNTGNSGYPGKKKKKLKHIAIHIDGEYMDITMNLLSAIAFSFSAPMIIPIDLFEIFIRSYLFKIMRYKYGWKFDIKFAANDQTLPVKWLWIGIAFNQIFTILFFFFALEGGKGFGTVLFLALAIIDIYLIRMKCKGKEAIFLRERFARQRMKNKHVSDAQDDRRAREQKEEPVSNEPNFNKQVTVYDYDDYWKCEICTMINENNVSNCKMCNNSHITWNKPNGYDEDQKVVELAGAWTVMYTDKGRKYYQNNITQETQWDKPGTYVEMQPEQKEPQIDIEALVDEPPGGYEEEQLPNGWSVMYTNDGRKYYQNDITKITSWDMPREIERDNGQELPLPDGWTKSFTDGGKVYYQNDKSKQTQWVHPTEKNFGWMVKYTNDGRRYYQNEITKETQWNKPDAFVE